MDINLIRVKEFNSHSKCFIDIRNVYSIYYSDEYSIFHTREGKYLCPITLIGIEDLQSEYSFIRSDRFIYVNFNLIRKYHSRLNVILFDNVESVKKARTLGLPEAFMHTSFTSNLVRLLGKEQDLAFKKEKKGLSFIFTKNYADEIG